jgi:5-dehydro-2-deoxygluconokinase
LTRLDVITIGRSSVDLYGQQVGGRLEDMASFRKYVGGSSNNMAIGATRLGLRAGLITRVGDEHMGRFIRETLCAEGVDVRGVLTDSERLTALVLLGIRDQDQFSLIFYRENCADMALSEDDIDPAYIAEAGCVTVTGTHLSHPRTEAAVLKALRLARENGARTALDIDFRPNLWGLAGHGAGESRFIASAAVTAKLRPSLHLFDLIVGTEVEFHIAGGTTNAMGALRSVRQVTGAILVCKRGPMGAAAFEGGIPASLDDGLSGPGFPIEVYNVLGAGDGFLAGLLRGWLRDAPWQTALTYANACGAFAVSRHGCAPSYPSWPELEWFLEHGSKHRALHHDAELEHIHWATTRRGVWPEMRVFAFDHRKQLEDMAAEVGIDPVRIAGSRRLCLDVANQVADGRPGYGILCDQRLGSDALYAAAGTGLWIGRPQEQVAKVLCLYHPDDSPELRAEQEETILRLADAVRGNGLEFLLEIIPSKAGPMEDDTTARVINRIYQIGVRPDWWKLEPMTSDAAWACTCAAIEQNDPWCRGVVVFGAGRPRGGAGRELRRRRALRSGQGLRRWADDFCRCGAGLVSGRA